MASIFCVPPMLFATFHAKYGISYTLLGTLVLINFFTQLCIDLVFTFFSKHFNVKKTVTAMPLITCVGLLVYATVPTLFPDYAFLGLSLGTVIFSVSAGLSEVLLSPIVAAMPSEHHDRDMSLLHSLYAWGMVAIILLSSLYFNVFGTENWIYLIYALSVLPLLCAILFSRAEIPDLTLSKDEKQSGKKKIGAALALCFICIFLGAATENVMTNWISGYMETALGISKELCDVLGIALFSLLLGIARLLFAKFGKSIIRVLILSFAGAVLCYLCAGICSVPAVGAIACVLCGFFVSMLWPGTLIMMEEYYPALGVFAYALMAAGGDMGSSLAPQLMGVLTDSVAASDLAGRLSVSLQISTEQIGLKAGMLLSAIFPVAGLVLMFIIRSYFKRPKNAEGKNNA